MLTTSQKIKKTYIYRMFFDIAFIFFAVFAPWWFMYILIILGMTMFGFFFEGIIYAMVIDIVFGSRTFQYWSVPYFFTVATLLTISVVMSIRRSTRIYAS